MHRLIDRIDPAFRTAASTIPIHVSICVLITLFVFSTSARNASAEESDIKSGIDNSHAIHKSVSTFLNKVKQSHADARPLVVTENVSDEQLKELSKLLIAFDAINTVSAKQAPTYATDDLAVALVPLYYRSGVVNVILLELKAFEGKWLINRIERIDFDKSIERLIAFREKNPNATSVTYVSEPPPSAKKIASVIDRARWHEAAELAIKYARENPPRPINRRPESLRSMELTPEKISELLAGDWDTEIVSYLGPYATETILDGMRSTSPEIRRLAVHALWSRPVTQWNMQILVQLEELLTSDPDPKVRTEVVYMLNRLDNETAVSMLLGPALADKDKQVFNAVISHLERRKDPRAFDQVLKQLELETDWQRQYKIASALLSCDQEKAWQHVMRLALNETSDSRGFQLIGFASRNWEDLQTRYFWPWPFELRDLERIVYNVYTVEGEKYGQREIDKLIEYIAGKDSDPALRSDCRRALIALHPSDTKRLIELAQDHEYETSSFHRVLAAIPTEKSVRFLTSEFLASEQKRNMLFSGDDATGRWQVPLLMVLLDDPSLKGEFKFDFNPMDPRAPLHQDIYRTNRAFTTLTNVLRNEGFEIPWTNAAHDKYDLQVEIGEVKSWWREHGKAFMSNKRVPEPKISSMLFVD